MNNSNNALLETKVERLTAHDLVKKHIQNPNHVITDEEFQNISVAEAAVDKNKLDKETNLKKEKLENVTDTDTLPNPYTVVG